MNWTISSLLDWTTLYFTKHGIENPHLEAEILMAHSLSLKRIDLYVQHERILKEEELADFKALILRRVKKEPSAYITGNKPFMSLDFIVTKDVLIPRPETEHLVQAVLDITKAQSGKQFEILDLCAGSGAVAVSIARYCRDCRVTAADISASALEIARQNATKHGVSDRVSFAQGDLFGAVKDNKTFDIIVSNPPYIPSEEIPKLQPEIRKFEPVLALDGGNDGLDFYRRMIKECAAFLKTGGCLVLEIGFGQAEAVKELIKAAGSFNELKVTKDHADIDRVIVAAHSS